MAPRGRQRKRITRLDAAIDAMSPLGFSKKLIRDKAKELLKVYGGDESWYFIEQDSYEVLREALLSHVEENDPEKIEQDENREKDVSNSETPADCSVAIDFPRNTEIPNNTNLVDHVQSSSDRQCIQTEGVGTSTVITAAEEHGKSWKDIGLDQCNPTPEKSSIPSSSLMIPSPTPIPRRHRRPCYGWIESDEEDFDYDDIISFPVQIPTVKFSPIGSISLGKRKSRWDLKPEDP